MLSLLSKNFSRWHFEIFFLFFLENKIWYFMQIVSLGENLLEMANPIFCENKKNIIGLSSPESAQRTVKVNKQ